MSDIFTRLLLDTKDFESKLGKAKNSTNNFASNIGGKVAGAVGKFAAGLGIAMGAAEAFDKVIKSSQTTSDAWNNSLSACKDTVNAFFQSLSSGNWSAFNDGLFGTLQNMREVAQLRDMLGDAKLTMGFDTRQFEKEYVRLEGIIDDETRSKGEREKAFAEMQTLISTFRQRVEATGRGAAETLVKEMNAKFGKDFTLGDIEQYIKEVNNEFLNTETLQRLNKYKETLKLFDKYRSYSLAEYGGLVMTKEQFMEANPFLEKMRLLQDDTDESRRNMVEQYEYMLQLFQKADDFFKRSLEKQNKVTNLNKGTTTSPKASFKGANLEATIWVNTQLNYDTPLGKKVMEAMQGDGTLPIITQPIEIEEENIDEIPLPDTKEVKDLNGALSSTADIFGSIGSIAGTAGDDFLSASMGMMGNISNMILQLHALSTAQGVASASKLPFPANLAAIATVVATIASMFASLPKFAEGGIVGGSSFFGDKLLARVNSGEMILNQQQQGRLLAMTSNNNVRVSGDVRLNGKDIYISLRNYMKSSGNKL